MKRLLLALVVALFVLGLVARLTGRGGEEPIAAPHAGNTPAVPDEPVGPVAAESSTETRKVAAPPPSFRAEAAPATPVAPDEAAQELPILLTGLVVDGNGAGVPGASVKLTRHIVDSGGFGMRMVEIRPLPRLTTSTDAEGRFEVRGEQDGEVVISAEKGGYALREQITRVLPATGVTLTLERAGGILVTVAPAALELAEQVYVEVRAPGGERDVDDGVRAFREGRALREGLLPDLYDVVVVGQRNRRPLFTVADVQVRGGETTEDLRLLDLDLRALLKKIRVTVVDSDERPMPGITVHLFHGSTRRGFKTDDDGSIELAAGAEGADVAVREDGWRNVRHDAVTEDLVIQLQRPLALRLVRPAGRSAELGDLYLYVARVPAESVEPTHEDCSDWTLAADEDAVEVALDEAGTYRIHWAVTVDYGGRGSGNFYPPAGDPQVVEVAETEGTQEVVLELDPAAVAELRSRTGALADELEQQPGETDDEHSVRVMQVILRENRKGR